MLLLFTAKKALLCAKADFISFLQTLHALKVLSSHDYKEKKIECHTSLPATLFCFTTSFLIDLCFLLSLIGSRKSLEYVKPYSIWFWHPLHGKSSFSLTDESLYRKCLWPQLHSRSFPREHAFAIAKAALADAIALRYDVSRVPTEKQTGYVKAMHLPNFTNFLG